MAEGDDAWWAAAIFIGAPNAVTNLRVTARSATSLTWEFGAPSGGGPITRYEYRSQFENGSFSGAWTSTGTTRRIVLSGLTRNTAYKVQVRAVGPAGNGPDVEDSDSTGALTPRKPTNFSVTATGQAFRLQARVDNGGSAITKWQRRGASSSGGVASATWTDIDSSAADTLDWTSGDFGYSTQRFFQVRAVSALGEGQSSDIEDATTGARPLAAPGPPRNLTAVVTGSTITWSWDAPDSGGAVARYEYRISSTATFSGGWQDNSTSRTFSLVGLSRGATRHIQVRAVNATDSSTAVTDAATTTSPPVDNTAPTFVSASLNTAGNTLTIVFDEDLAGTAPALSAFNIQRDPAVGANQRKGGSGISLSDNTVIVTFSVAFLATDTVTVAYTEPAQNPLQDEAGNTVVDFGPENVTNNVTLPLPGPVRNLAESAVTRTSITWGWDAPNTGGAVASYEYRTAAGATAFSGNWTTTGTTRSVTLSSLTAGSTHRIQVRARNATGPAATADIQEDSATTSADTTTMDTDHIWALGTAAPTAPAGGTSTENHAPTGWQRTEPSPTATENVYRASRTRTFTNGSFTSATTWASVTKVADATGPVATAPSKPTGFTVTPSGNTVRLRASVNNGGSAITKWQYRNAAVNFIGIASWQDIAASNADDLDFTLTVGYSDTSEYQVRAVNAVDTGPQSDTVTATTPAEPVTSTAPAKPTNFRATVSRNTVRLRASVDNGGSAITKWQYRSASTEAGLSSASWTDLPTSAGDDLDETVTQAYSRLVYYAVRAVNDIGNGDASDAVSATTGAAPVVRPGAVTNLMAMPDGTELDVSYNAPDSGSAVVRYEYRSQRISRAWDSGLAGPTADRAPRGVAVAPNGDILIVSQTTDRVYRHNGTSWDSGLALPSGATAPHGVAVASNGDILIADFAARRVYRHNGTSWDDGLAPPMAVTALGGLSVASNGDILIVDSITDRVYRYNGTSWDSGLALPSGARSAVGVAVAPNGDILVVSQNTGLIYRYNGTSWDSGRAPPSGATDPNGVTVASNGDILIVSQTTRRVYRYAAGEPSAWVSNGTNLSATLTSLTAGVNYKIEVRAWNTAGYGPEASVEGGIPTWDSGFAVPTAAGRVWDIAVAPNGDILIADRTGFDFVYRYNGTSWDSGLATPTGTSNTSGIAVASNGDILISDNVTFRIYRYNGTSWDNGVISTPRETGVDALAVAPNGDILAVGNTVADRQNTGVIRRYDGTSWSSVASSLRVPGANNGSAVNGVAVAANGDILVLNDGVIYRYNGTSWDDGFAAPSAQNRSFSGVAIAANGAILVVARQNRAHSIYRYGLS